MKIKCQKASVSNEFQKLLSFMKKKTIEKHETRCSGMVKRYLVLDLGESSSGSSFSMGLEVLSLGELHFGRVVNGQRVSSDIGCRMMVSIGQGWGGMDGGNRKCGSEWSWADREVSAGDTETVHGIADVVGRLEETVSVNVGVGSTGNTIGRLDLGLGRRTTAVTV